MLASDFTYLIFVQRDSGVAFRIKEFSVNVNSEEMVTMETLLHYKPLHTITIKLSHLRDCVSLDGGAWLGYQRMNIW